VETTPTTHLRMDRILLRTPTSNKVKTSLPPNHIMPGKDNMVARLLMDNSHHIVHQI
jgi:hypothetical protein